MKLRTLAMASVAAMVFAGPAAAQTQGWYIGLGMGPTSLRSSISFAKVFPPDTLNYDDTVQFSGTIGYKIGRNLRIEFETNYAKYNIAYIGNLSGYRGYARVSGGYVNLLYDQPIADTGFNLTLGIGGGRQIRLVDINEFPPGVGTLVSGSQEDFSWRGIIGFSGQLTENSEIQLDYRYSQPQPAPGLSESAFSRLEERLGNIAARLDESAHAAPADSHALASLENQIAHLSTLISQPVHTQASLSPELDARMAAIEDYMASNDEYIIEAARQAAEAVLDAYTRNNLSAGTNLADMTMLTDLATDLRNLEALSRRIT